MEVEEVGVPPSVRKVAMVRRLVLLLPVLVITACGGGGQPERTGSPPGAPSAQAQGGKGCAGVLAAAEDQLAKANSALEARRAVPDTDVAAKASAQKAEDEEAKRLEEMIVERPNCFTPTTVAEAQKALAGAVAMSSPRRDYKADAVAVCEDKGRQEFGASAAYFAPDPVIVGGPQGSFYSYTIIGQVAPGSSGPYMDYECNADLYVDGRVDVRFTER